MQLRDIAISRLKEYENNPRNNDLAVEKVKYSIGRFGFLVPVIIDLNFVIVAGHTRVRACKELGISFIPCIVIDDLTQEQINFFRLVDNKTSEYSDWDFEKLKEELESVDLTLEANQLLLERFELTTEVFDIEPEQAEIKVASFNFMGLDEQRKQKKPTVHTIQNNLIVESENNCDSTNEVSSEFVSGKNDYGIDSITPSNTHPASIQNIEEKVLTDAPTKPSKAILQFCQFRFGEISFFISQVELDKLNERYAEYIDSGAILEKSFVNYLLDGITYND